MPHNPPDLRHRAQLTELMDEPCSREELRACLRDIAKVNRWMMGYRPWFLWLDAMLPRLAGRVRILDVGCGNGDGIRRIAQWAAKRGIDVDMIGLDINADTVAIAADETSAAHNIQWICSDVFAYEPPAQIHIVVSSLFTHHLDDSSVVRFVAWMEQHATLGWFINDLSRSAVPYRFFRIFSKLARLHPFVQHDGPVSIARAFQPEDWREICAAAGLKGEDVSISGYKPARLCVARSRPR
jgi:2-polyprenyl-3-methyl-5-hydroxy-6-metoxy-1,4-benzoquinol methylase